MSITQNALPLEGLKQVQQFIWSLAIRVIAATAAAATLVGVGVGDAQAATRIVERTAPGAILTVYLSGHGGRVAVACADGRPAGSAGFRFTRGRRFTAADVRAHHTRWTFTGRIDRPGHVRGHGHFTAGTCAPDPRSFSEGPVGEAFMTSCPQSSLTSPLVPGTSYPFAGRLPNASQGTRLRIEYTRPDGSDAVDHVRTDMTGAFHATHAFEANDHPWGSTITPRFPDDALADGHGCDVEVA
jgi:hypothetical protein